MSKRVIWAAALLLLLVVGGAASGCGDTIFSVSTDGRIEVAVSSAGTDPDRDGFSVSVDGGAEQLVSSQGAVTLQDLGKGSHSVRLTGVAENCAVNGSNPRSVVVGADGRGSVRFEVRCARITTGAFIIVVETRGELIDTDGYALAVAGAGIRFIGLGGSETFMGLETGDHLVTLKDVDARCEVVGGNPRPFTVVAGRAVELRLTVACGPAQQAGASYRG